MWEWLEYAAAWVALKSLGLLPRRVARAVGAALEQVISEGEIEDVRSQLPSEMRELFPT